MPARLFSSIDDLLTQHSATLQAAEAVLVGSYVPEGVAATDALASLGLTRFCFYDIDTPVTLAKLDRGDEDYLARRQIPLFDVYFSFSGGPVLTRLEQDYGARRAEALYCSVDAQRYQPTGAVLRWDLGYLGTYSPDRQPTLERLLLEPARRLPERRFMVAGPQYPAEIDWPANVERIEHLPPAEHAAFYSAQRFTLNVTRADMIAAGWSPSVRLFEAAACGTPIISDIWPGLTELLPVDEAIVLARTSQDVVDALDSINEAERDTIAQKARDLVLAGHTGEARSRQLLAALAAI